MHVYDRTGYNASELHDGGIRRGGETKSEKAKVDQCCSTFRLHGLWPIYTATWLYESKVYYWCLGGSVIYASARTTVFQFFVIIALEFKENNAIFEFYEENAVYSIFQNIFWMKIE